MKSADRQLHERFMAALEEHRMLEGCSRPLVALSGGADSTALLLLLAELAEERGLSVAAFHLNHMLRGREADRDEAFCASLCESRGIPLHVERVDVAALARDLHKGIEETARSLRYAAVRRLCTAHHYDCAAFAHNADDNIETLLFRLARGSSLRGMRGIPPLRYEGDCRIIRPLITCEKQLIRDALTERGQRWVEDSTNGDTTYTRNRIRCEIIPLLKSINPALTDSITTFAKAAGRDDDALTSLADAHSPTEGRRALAALPDALLSRLLTRAWDEQKNGGQLTSRHLDDMMRLLRSDTPRASLSLPGRVRFTLERDSLSFTADMKQESETPPPVLLREGANRLPGGALLYAFPTAREAAFAKDINTAINIYKLAISESLDSDKIKGAVYIRTKEEGDRIFCGGMHHKVKTLFSDRKIPLARRRLYPILCDEMGILLIPGIACRDGAAVTADTETPLALRYFAPEA